MHRLHATALFALASLTAPTLAPASAQDVAQTRTGMFDASDPRGITTFMQRAGYQAQLASDAEGNPQINGRLSRSDYVISFYECENGLFCNSIQFLSTAPATETTTLEAANAFNVAWRYARASLVNNQVRLQMDVNLDAGVTADNLRDTLDIWRQLLSIFERELLGHT